MFNLCLFIILSFLYLNNKKILPTTLCMNKIHVLILQKLVELKFRVRIFLDIFQIDVLIMQNMDISAH